MNNIDKVEQFLNDVPVFYLTTVEGDKPKCRPIGFHMLIDDKLYFGIGTFKDVYKQIQKNPNVEICACKNNEFVRYYGKAVFETDDRISDMALSFQPFLRKTYNETTGKKLGMFYLENATAEFRTMTGIKESISF